MIRSRRSIEILGAALLLGGLLAGCGSQAAPASPTSAPQPTAQAAPTSAPAPTDQPKPTAMPAPTSAPAPTEAPAAQPELYYVDQGNLMAVAPNSQPREVASLPGNVLDAALTGDTLLVLREDGLAKIELPGGASSDVLTFDRPARAGSRLLLARGQVFYAAWADDPNAVFGNTIIGVYDPQSGQARDLTTAEGGAAPLGLTPDGQGLYVLPIGGDPSFVQLNVINLADGKPRAQLPVTGEGWPAVSPDGRYLITTAREFSQADPNAEPASLLYLYDLTAPAPQAQAITPPEGPSAATNPFWSPDSRGFYFALGQGNIYELKNSRGLWVYDLASGQAAQLADVDVLNSFFTQISPAGAVLRRHTTSADSQLVDLASGAQLPIELPPSAVIAGWH